MTTDSVGGAWRGLAGRAVPDAAFLSGEPPEPPGVPPAGAGDPSGPPVYRPDLSVLFRGHQLELVRLATLLTGDQPTAEDIVQDVFARVYPRWYTLTDRGSDPLPYIRASVINGCRSAHRRRGAARRRAGAPDALARPADAGSAEDAVLLSEDRQQVLRALARLPGRQREALVLRYYLDLPVAEIAAAMGISRGTVKSTISRGLAALARAIGEES